MEVKRCLRGNDCSRFHGADVLLHCELLCALRCLRACWVCVSADLKRQWERLGWEGQNRCYCCSWNHPMEESLQEKEIEGC
jgi:hypothetical protein